MTTKSEIEYPITEELNISKKYNGIPELVDLNFDLWTLKVKLEFPDLQNPVYLTFKNVGGFRVLDEGSLMEFWNNEKRSNGWLWKVKKGGWHDQEKKREGFAFSREILANYDEYMVVGIGMCLNLIGGTEPIITEP
jgi:hypothetical protein